MRDANCSKPVTSQRASSGPVWSRDSSTISQHASNSSSASSTTLKPSSINDWRDFGDDDHPGKAGARLTIAGSGRSMTPTSQPAASTAQHRPRPVGTPHRSRSHATHPDGNLPTPPGSQQTPPITPSGLAPRNQDAP